MDSIDNVTLYWFQWCLITGGPGILPSWSTWHITFAYNRPDYTGLFSVWINRVSPDHMLSGWYHYSSKYICKHPCWPVWEMGSGWLWVGVLVTCCWGLNRTVRFHTDNLDVYTVLFKLLPHNYIICSHQRLIWLNSLVNNVHPLRGPSVKVALIIAIPWLNKIWCWGYSLLSEGNRPESDQTDWNS